MTNRGFLVWVGVIAALAPSVLLAETAYVSDQLEITLRRGQGTQFGIRAMLDSGAQVEVLQEDEASGYTEVRTRSGTEGWVLSRYLQPAPVARTQVAGARQAQAKAEQKAAALQAEFSTVQADNDSMKARISDLEAQLASAQEELRRVSSVAARPVEIQRRNEQLVEEVRALEQDRDRLSMELHSERSRRDNWITGALIAFGGLVFGLIAPHLRRRKSGWEGLS